MSRKGSRSVEVELKDTIIDVDSKGSASGRRKKKLKFEVPVSRKGKKATVVYLESDKKKQLNMIALKNDKTVQELMEEAVHLLIIRYLQKERRSGKWEPPISL